MMTRHPASASLALHRSRFALLGFRDIHPPAPFGDDLLKPTRKQAVTLPSEILIPSCCRPALPRARAVGRQHQLEITDALGGGACRHFGEHVSRLVGRRSKLFERREEVIVAVQRRVPVAHRHRVDRRVEEPGGPEHGRDRWPTRGRVARARNDRHRRRREA
jgi:hypothetical protein